MLAAVSYLANGDGLPVVDAAVPTLTYRGAFALVALDGVIPVFFPGETTLNAASTAAAQGTLELLPVIVIGALARSSRLRVVLAGPTLLTQSRAPAEPAKSNRHVRQALDIMDASAPNLIVGGRYVPGLRFVVNATMGLSTIKYRRFLAWSVLSGVLWSVYTWVLAYQIGLSFGEYPLASVVISGLVTTSGDRTSAGRTSQRQ